MIQFFHVHKSYPGSAPVLENVSFDIGKGEFVFLTGPSGAGKSTLMKLILAQEAPNSGQVRVLGANVGRLHSSAVPYLRRNLGVVFQDFKLLPHRTVAENVALALEVLGVPRREVTHKVKRMLQRVGLEHHADFFPRQLSGGEQQRVAIARALINEPAILLADEPTGNLDPALTLEMMKLLLDINVLGTTVVVASHDVSLLNRFDKRMLELKERQVIEARSPTRVRMAGKR